MGPGGVQTGRAAIAQHPKGVRDHSGGQDFLSRLPP